MILLQNGFCLIQIDLLGVLVLPGQAGDEIEVVVEHAGFRTVLPLLLVAVEDFISLYSRNEPFLMGQLSFASIIFDLAVTVLALALTVYGLDRARRRGLK